MIPTILFLVKKLIILKMIEKGGKLMNFINEFGVECATTMKYMPVFL